MRDGSYPEGPRQSTDLGHSWVEGGLVLATTHEHDTTRPLSRYARSGVQTARLDPKSGLSRRVSSTICGAGANRPDRFASRGVALQEAATAVPRGAALQALGCQAVIPFVKLEPIPLCRRGAEVAGEARPAR